MSINEDVLAHCRTALPGWAGLDVADCDFAEPKGFSSFTMAVRATAESSPSGVFYRRLAGKENAILDSELEREVYLLLAEAGLAADCLHYAPDFRLETLYEGVSLSAEDLS